jgi:hypothetical protein
MPFLVDKAAAGDRDDLIDAVAELIAAVFDVNGRLALRPVPAADIGDAGHRRNRC